MGFSGCYWRQRQHRRGGDVSKAAATIPGIAGDVRQGAGKIQCISVDSIGDSLRTLKASYPSSPLLLGLGLVGGGIGGEGQGGGKWCI